MAASFEVLKPEIEKHVRYLKSCVKQKFFSKKKMAGEQTGTVLDRLEEFGTFRNSEYTFGIGFIHEMGKYMVKEGVCITFIQLWKHLFYTNKDKSASQGDYNFDRLLYVCGYLTDCCREFGDELVALGFVQILLDAIDDDQDDEDDDDDKQTNRQTPTQTNIYNIFCILQNCIRMSNNRDVYRKSNALPVLQRCLKSSRSDIRLYGLIILAYVVKENEREILATSKVGLHALLEIYKSAVETPDNHRGIDGFSAFEALDAINHLAINDTNKGEIEKQGAIPDIIRMLQDDFSDEERRVAAETIWNLSFVESIRELEVVQKTIPTLEKLVKSDNKELRGACASALWEIKGRTLLASVEESPPTYEEATADVKPTEPAPTKKAELGTSARPGLPMIMLSYQWDSQQLVLKIKDRLEMAGCSVWMDINNIEGDILGAMAKAVKTSDVILMCMSERYQESRSCRSEVTYAYKLEKKIIPLMLEPEYKPDGWLGLLQGMDLYYFVHSDEELDKNMPTLLKRIGEYTSRPTEDLDTVDGPIQPQGQQICQVSPPAPASSPPAPASSPPVHASSPPVHASSPPVHASSPPVHASSPPVHASSPPVHASSPPLHASLPPVQAESPPMQAVSRSTSVDQWSKSDVQNWLRENDLGDICPSLASVKGKHLRKLNMQLEQNEGAFKEEMKSDYKIFGRFYLLFTDALEELFPK